MDEALDITILDKETAKEDEYEIKHEDPQYEYDTTCDDMDEYVGPNE